MYEGFFSLNTKPFELVPDPDFLFLGRPHKKALTYLEYGIKERVGFILLTGEIGSGKTTLIRTLIGKLKKDVTVSKVFNTKVSSEQLFSMINEDFGLEAAGKDKVTMLRELNDFLIGQYTKKHQPVLIIDEAQNLSAELLEEVRMLSNLETDKSKLLQIILVGQPELRTVLSSPGLLQLRQRISISCHLQSLTREEMEEYIFHRLEVAGNRDAVAFPGEAMDIVFDFSRGTPRLVNTVCDFLLLAAFVEGTTELSASMVREVIDDLKDEHSDRHNGQPESVFPYGESMFNEIIERIDSLEMVREEVRDLKLIAGDLEERIQRMHPWNSWIKSMTGYSRRH